MNDAEKLIEIIKRHAIDHVAGTAIPGQDIDDDLGSNELGSSNLYINEKAFEPGDTIEAGYKQITADRETILVFSDDEPLLNWAHKCRYLLYDSKNSELYKEIEADAPPYMTDIPGTYNSFFTPVVFPDAAPINYHDIPGDNLPPPHSTGRQKYALLYSGKSENRHVNDMEYLYRTLIDYHHFHPDNIYVLNYDGTIKYSSPYKLTDIRWPGNGTKYRMKVNAEGTSSEFNNAFDELAERLKPEDLLFIHTNNHGVGIKEPDAEGESSLWTYANKYTLYTASEFGEKIARLPKIKQMLVFMEQCHSGGFLNPILKNSKAEEICFISACAEHKTSTGGKYYNVFANYWIKNSVQMKGMMNPQDAEINPLNFGERKRRGTDPNNIVKAAFESAEIWSPPDDTPIIHEQPAGCSRNIKLTD